VGRKRPATTVPSPRGKIWGLTRRSTGRADSWLLLGEPQRDAPVTLHVRPRPRASLMRASVAPVMVSRRALGLRRARRAPLYPVRVRCGVLIAVKLATTAFDALSGAACWTRRGSCAHRARGLALRTTGGRASVTGVAVANRRLCSSKPCRSPGVGGSSRVAFAVDRGPNPSVNRTRRFMTSTWLASSRRAGYLAR
jgi:hypothetical protein